MNTQQTSISISAAQLPQFYLLRFLYYTVTAGGAGGRGVRTSALGPPRGGARRSPYRPPCAAAARPRSR
eukprot:467107-Prorocentrum_minimum.AAC.1